MKSYNTLLLSICMSLCLASSASAQQTLFGNVKDDIGDPVIGGTVKVLKGTSLITGAATDFDGNYSLNLDPGTYTIEFSYIGYTPQRIEEVEVLAKQRNKLDMHFEESGGIILSVVGRIGRCGAPPLIDVSETSQGMIIHSREIRRLSKPN